MRRLLSAFLVVGLVGLAAQTGCGPAKAPSGTDDFAALKKEYEDAEAKLERARNQAQEALAYARTEGERAEAQKKLATLDYDGLRKFSPRFLDFAAGHADAPAAADALAYALRAARGPQDRPPAWGDVVGRLRADFADKPAVVGVVRILAFSDDDATAVVREVLTKNPDHKVQARACKALARAGRAAADLAVRLKDDNALREEAGRRRGKEFVEKMTAHADAYRKEADDLDAMLHDRYADVYPDLSVGKEAPEVVSQDLDGKEVRLSALRGKVVVLDVWATWCGPCRAMIPHEKEMVERLKDRPFVLVGISLDDSREKAADFVSRQKMAWTHWWGGGPGGIAEDWDIQTIPATYVLDAKGVIRHKGLRDEELEDAVNVLLKEAEETK